MLKGYKNFLKVVCVFAAISLFAAIFFNSLQLKNQIGLQNLDLNDLYSTKKSTNDFEEKRQNHLNKSQQKDQERPESLSYNKAELKKQKWGEYLASHPYYNRSAIPYKDWKAIPKTDRPDLAAELEFLKTVDPALGIVPTERLGVAAKQIQEQFQNKAAITNVNWEERGPNNVSGRTRAILFDPNDGTNKKVWAGGVGGGLWYTNDITVASPIWVKVNDFWDNIAISTIAYNPANTQEIFVGTGEGFGNSDSRRGAGIWKSADGGATWNRLANTDPGAYNSATHFHYIQKIVVKNNGYIFAATKGYFTNYGGIMRSTDGGTNWTRVCDASSGTDWAADIELASNGDLYCSLGIGGTSRVYKNTNANNGASGTWTEISTNLPVGAATRIEMATAPSNSSVIYAVADGGAGDTDVLWFKKSTDGGTTWSDITTPLMVDGGGDHFTRGQAWYDLILSVHPADANLVLSGGVDLHRSLDGGTTWTGISHWYGGYSKPEVHADQHNIAFRPGNSNEVLFSNDGGLTFSTNAGNAATTPSFQEADFGYNVTQFYGCAMANEVNSNYFLAGAQDNGSQQFINPQLNSTSEVTGGDGAFCQIDQLNSNIQTTQYTYNTVYRSTNGGSSFPQIISESTGHFINPSEYDSDRKIFYSAADNDRVKRISGMDGTITNTDLTISVGGSKVSALKISPYNDVLFLGIANARIYKFSNASTGAPTFTRIDNGTTPISASGWVSSIDVGANDNHILVTYSNYGVTSIWETTDGGINWYSKEGNIPDMPVRWAIYNPDNRNQVLAATEMGVWSTDNFQPGTNAAPVWGSTNLGLAYVRCEMLKYRTSDKLVAVATHGRGLYTSDIFVNSSVADFTYDESISCSGSLTVQFTDGSLKANSSWQWDVNNDGVVDYTTRNPSHTYSSPGLYSVKLTVNSGGASVTKTNIIYVGSAAPTANTGCTLSSNSNNSNGFGIGISNFALQNIDYSSDNNDGHYKDYTCSAFTPLSLGTNYNISITTGTSNNEGAKVYIDYDDNGIFAASELVLTFPANMDGTRTLSFTTPSSGVTMDKGLRLRVLSKFNSAPTDACNISTYGQAEDYTVYFPSAVGLPVTLLYFDGLCNERNTEFHWATASEQSNDYFTIESSRDGINFDFLKQIDGAGNSSELVEYSLSLPVQNLDQMYYRLKQTDFDGTETIHDLISVDCEDLTNGMTVYPNPTQGSFVISGLRIGSLIEIVDTKGNVLKNLISNNQKEFINLQELPEGMYYVKVKSDQGQEVQKLVIAK